MMSGFAEEHFMNDTSFNNMKRTFDAHGYTLDPNATHSGQIVGDLSMSKEKNGKCRHNLMWYMVGLIINEMKKQKLDRHEKGNVEDDTFLGPWAGFKKDDVLFQGSAEKGEPFVPQPIFDTSKIAENRIVETSTYHGIEERDYLGRSFLHPPNDVGVDLKGTVPENFIPKQLIHTWTGHTKVFNLQYAPLIT
jgi:pre-mRNA-processing factor 17